jgi:hypothetical protein
MEMLTYSVQQTVQELNNFIICTEIWVYLAAMNSTKRKFNTLLNGLGSRPSSAISSTSTEFNSSLQHDPTADGEIDTQTKKRRFSYTTSITSQRPTRTMSSLIASRHKKSTSSASIESPRLDAPKYAPWDRDAFYERLKSFRTLTNWTPKPDKVNEVQWAKRGWVCQKFERVRCCTCNVELLVGLNKKVVDGVEEQVLVAQNIGM